MFKDQIVEVQVIGEAQSRTGLRLIGLDYKAGALVFHAGGVPILVAFAQIASMTPVHAGERR